MVEAPACKPVQPEFEKHSLPTNKNKTDRQVDASVIPAILEQMGARDWKPKPLGQLA